MEAIDWNAELDEPQERTFWLTLEGAAYIAVALVAAAVRLYQLGLRPLSGTEAAQALAAFRFTQDMAYTTPAGTVPALFTGNLVGFTLWGASDVTVRWLPALAGLVLVLLPFGLRHRLGRAGALAASFLLAISPLAVYFSRSLDGAMVVAASGLAMVVGLVRLVDTHRPGDLLFSAGALAVGLCAGPGFYSLLLILVAFALLLYLGQRLLDRDAGWPSLLVAWWALRSENGLLAKAGAVLAATFGLVAMAFVLNPAGVGHAADLIGEWAKGFLSQAQGQPWIYPLLLLLRYESLILLLGLVELGRWVASTRTEQRDGTARYGSAFPHTAFLAFWTLAALVIVLVAGHRPPGNVLLVVVPLALLAGQGSERAWRWISRRNLWFETGVVALVAVGIGIFFYLQVAAFGLSSGATTVSLAGIDLAASVTYLLLGAVALLLLVGLGAAAWAWRGPSLLLSGGCLFAVIVLGLFGFKAMWGASVAHASDARELVILQTTAPDVRLLVDRLEALSLEEAGDAHTLPLTVAAETGPVVAWYLRDFEEQSVVDGISAPPATIAAVTLAAQDLPIGETFRGQGFPLRMHWLPWGLWGQDLVQWLLFTEAGLPVVDQELVLWVLSQP